MVSNNMHYFCNKIKKINIIFKRNKGNHDSGGHVSCGFRVPAVPRARTVLSGEAAGWGLGAGGQKELWQATQ